MPNIYRHTVVLHRRLNLAHDRGASRLDTQALLHFYDVV